MGKFIDLTGQRFGKLVVLSQAKTHIQPNGKKVVMWIVRCDCGKEFSTQGLGLRGGTTKSCGCYNKQRTKEAQTTHGQSRTRLYTIWQGIKQRCYNQNSINYSNYGGRGITVCDEWNEFEPFYEWSMINGYSSHLTIDRINPDGNYEPSNCRWVDMSIQEANKRLLKSNTSGYRGICWDKENNKWAVSVTVHGKNNKIGRFKSLKEAVDARNNFIDMNRLSYPKQYYKAD